MLYSVTEEVSLNKQQNKETLFKALFCAGQHSAENGDVGLA
jgi:hypothetical protein